MSIEFTTEKDIGLALAVAESLRSYGFVVDVKSMLWRGHPLIRIHLRTKNTDKSRDKVGFINVKGGALSYGSVRRNQAEVYAVASKAARGLS